MNHGPVTFHEALHLAFRFLVFRDLLVQRAGRRQDISCMMLLLCVRCCHLKLELHIVC